MFRRVHRLLYDGGKRYWNSKSARQSLAEVDPDIGLAGSLRLIGSRIQRATILQDSQRWLWSRIGDTVLAAACLGVIWFVFTWNMLHWNLRY